VGGVLGRSPKTLAVSGGVLEVSGVGFFGVAGIFACELAKAFLSPRRSLGPAIIAGIMACESAVPLPLADVAIN
jgi:hypothetical protein